MLPLMGMLKHLHVGAKVFSAIELNYILNDNFLSKFDKFSNWPYNITIEKWKRQFFNLCDYWCDLKHKDRQTVSRGTYKK